MLEIKKTKITPTIENEARFLQLLECSNNDSSVRAYYRTGYSSTVFYPILKFHNLTRTGGGFIFIFEDHRGRHFDDYLAIVHRGDVYIEMEEKTFFEYSAVLCFRDLSQTIPQPFYPEKNEGPRIVGWTVKSSDEHGNILDIQFKKNENFDLEFLKREYRDSVTENK